MTGTVIAQVQALDTDTNPIDQITGNTLTGGTATLVDLTGETGVKAWQPSGTLQALMDATVDLGSGTDTGVLISIRYYVVSKGSNANNSLPLAGSIGDTLADPNNRAQLRRSGNNVIAASISQTTNSLSLPAVESDGETICIRAVNNASGADNGDVWWTSGGPGDSPDDTQNTTWSAATIDSVFMSNAGDGVYQYADIVIATFDPLTDTPTDAECRAIVNDIRSVYPPNATVPPQGTVTIGSISVTTVSATVPFTYDDADQTGFEYRLDGGTPVDIGNTNSFIISGLTPNTGYSVEVRAYNANGDGAWSSVSNFTTSSVQSDFTITLTDPPADGTYYAKLFDNSGEIFDGAVTVTSGSFTVTLAVIAGTSVDGHVKSANIIDASEGTYVGGTTA